LNGLESVPEGWGGWELPAPIVVQVGTCLARYDASTAWVGMIGSTTHALAAFLPEEGAAEVYADGPDFLMGGLVPPPNGEARAGWAKLEAGEDLGPQDRAVQLLSAAHAAQTCARAVEIMYASAGSAALSLDGPLQRLLRDVHAAKQHALVSFGMYETAGGMLFAARA